MSHKTPAQKNLTELSVHQRTMDAMADEYSIRARRARAEQGLPEVSPTRSC